MAPEEGRSAIQAAAKAIADLRLGRVDEVTTANVGTITGGTAGNVVPEWCTFSAEARSHDEAKLGEVVQEMLDAFSFAATETECDVETTMRKSYDGYRLKRDEPAVALAATAFAQLRGRAALRALGRRRGCERLQPARPPLREPLARGVRLPHAGRARLGRGSRGDGRRDGRARGGRARVSFEPDSARRRVRGAADRPDGRAVGRARARDRRASGRGCDRGGRRRRLRDARPAAARAGAETPARAPGRDGRAGRGTARDGAAGAAGGVRLDRRQWRELAAFWTTPGFCRERMHLFAAEGVERGEASPEADEELELVRWPVAEVAARLDEIEDAKTFAGLLLYLGTVPEQTVRVRQRPRTPPPRVGSRSRRPRRRR